MKFDDKKFIAEQIRTHRKKAGLTQAELAEKVNLTTQHISRIEGGCYIPSLMSFFMIAEVLNMDLKAFGYNVKTTNNVRKDNLIKSVANANDLELIFYENLLNAADKSLNKVRSEIF